MRRVGKVGHSGCYCAHTGHVIWCDATSASSARVLMAENLLYKYNTCLLASILYGDWQGFLSIVSGLFIMAEIVRHIYIVGMQI